MKLNIINKDNQKGTMLETYGSAFVIESKWIKIAFIVFCFLTPFTNFLYTSSLLLFSEFR